MIRELEMQEIEKVYREEMSVDFPPEELKSPELIRRLKDEGRYLAFGNFDGEELTAYAFLIHEKDDPVYLLDFFAVCRGGRDKGTGSKFIQELFQLLHPAFWILEVEDVESASNEEERTGPGRGFQGRSRGRGGTPAECLRKAVGFIGCCKHTGCPFGI